jgi:hypothetical protein
MHKWLFGFFVAFTALGYLVISGALHLAEAMVKIVAYGAFGLALLFLLGGFFAFSKVKSSLSGN